MSVTDDVPPPADAVVWSSRRRSKAMTPSRSGHKGSSSWTTLVCDTDQPRVEVWLRVVDSRTLASGPLSAAEMVVDSVVVTLPLVDGPCDDEPSPVFPR
jgi:hypothetical protein